MDDESGGAILHRKMLSRFIWRKAKASLKGLKLTDNGDLPQNRSQTAENALPLPEAQTQIFFIQK